MESLGAWHQKDFKCSIDNMVRPHFVRLMALKEGYAEIITIQGNVVSKQKDSEIKEDAIGKYLSVFGGIKYYFDDIVWL